MNLHARSWLIARLRHLSALGKRYGLRHGASLAALSTAFVAGSVSAFSYVPLTDSALFDRSDFVVDGRIEAPPSRAVAGASVYSVAVDEVFRGALYGQQIQLIVPGTPGSSDGAGVVVSGAPQFTAGERVLLFLHDQGGRFVVQDLALGAFHQRVDATGQDLLARDLNGAQRLAVGVDPEGEGWVRDAQGFRAWLRDRAQGIDTVAAYWRRANTALTVTPKYTLEGSPPVRWFDFDSGRSVVVYADHSGLLGLLGGGYAEVKDAIAAWNADPLSNVRLSYGGVTSARSPLMTADGVNTVMFNDPYDDIPGGYSCRLGGVVATAAYHYTGTQKLNGTTFGRITETDVVVQDGVLCLLSLYLGANAAEAITHEIGHGLGLGHSCGDDNTPTCIVGTIADAAIMRASLHADGRGAAVGSDDLAGLRRLYPVDGGTVSVDAPGGGAPAIGSDGGSGGGSIDLGVLLLSCAALIFRRRRAVRS
ncbi:hypothetical protein E4T66_15515 [Sinimarinibacterium sp. CAU 1509]|uniref:hypothetical protein n=1 Tax=Sinimarinibacterium sp. CAU 1509 TaxID=2562283 RepID=UPI0010AB70E7|nr:hypothetical protein [Sinimarinibacterium sp. CAU 1509]TJY58994.1 hypothetical protein E4T66_15515 [Sinimarinibacterium sp. CAU 1509]